MTLRNEFNYLNSFIKLNESDAERCNALRNFLDSRDKVLLIDADSLVWWSCHKLFTISELKEMLSQHDRYIIEDYILSSLYNRFERSVHELSNHIEEQGINIQRIEFFFTRCNDNFRYWLLPTYKGNRKGYRSPFIKRLQTYAIDTLSDMYPVHFSSKVEADDLIADAGRFYGNDCIIASLDKDLKQVPGCHFDYYKELDKETNEKFYRGFSYTTGSEGKELLYYQLLLGDVSDNIKGCKGIGVKRAEKLLKGKKNASQWISVCRAYASKHENWKELLRLNIKLMKL